MAKVYLDKRDPVVKAQRIISQKIKAAEKNAEGQQAQNVKKEVRSVKPQLTASKNKSQDFFSNTNSKLT